MHDPAIRSLKRCLLAVLVLGTLVLTSAAGAQGPVSFYYFFDPICGSCEDAQEHVVEPLLAEYGSRIEIVELNIRDRESMELMLSLEATYGATGSEIPIVFIGPEMLSGYDAIAGELRGLIERYLAEGGVALPVPAAGPEPPVTAVPNGGGPSAAPVLHAVYFYQPGCDDCERSEHDLRYVQERYPQLVLERYNVREQATLNQYLSDAAGVPEAAHLTAPSFFIGERYLVGTEVRATQIEALLEPLVATGSEAWWQERSEQQALAEESIVRRFQAFGLLTVIGAGLIDGVNPCAFATMIFLISYLSVRKRQGRDLLLTGAAFALGVFVTYLAVGLGLLTFLDALPFLDRLGRWFYGLTAIVCLALAAGSILDYRKARQGRLHDMGLTLPDSLRNLSRKLIRQGTTHKRFVLSALVLGAGVSVVELACTGQVYLPTIIYVLGVPALRARATLALLLYNLMFILPLVGIFVLVYYGTTSEQLVGWLKRHAASVKLGMASLFLLLAGWLIYSIV